MGWHPASPEYANFPNPPKADQGKIIKGRRAHQTMKGTAKKKLPNVGSVSKSKPQHYTKLLAAQAISYGYLNGKRIAKRVHGDGKA